MPTTMQRKVVAALLPLVASSLLAIALLSEQLSSIDYAAKVSTSVELLGKADPANQHKEIHLVSKSATASEDAKSGGVLQTLMHQGHALERTVGKQVRSWARTALKTGHEDETALRHSFISLRQSLEEGSNATGADDDNHTMILGGAFEWHEGEAVGESKETGIKPLDDMLEGEEEIEKEIRRWVNDVKPEWIAARYAYLFLSTIVALMFIVAFLGLRKMERIKNDFAAWMHVGWQIHVYRMFLYPDFFKNIVDALFAVSRPIVVLRHFNLGVAYLGILTVVQPLMALLFTHWCNLRLPRVGNKQVEVEGIITASVGGAFMLGLLFPIHGEWAWLSGGPIGSFCLLVLAEALVGTGLTMYSTSLNQAMANPGLMPTSWAERTTQVLFAVSMLAKFIGAVIAGEVTQYLGVTIVYTLPVVLFLGVKNSGGCLEYPHCTHQRGIQHTYNWGCFQIMLALIWTIPNEWFPEDPDKKLMPLPLPPLLWESPIWEDSEARWLMITYTSYAVLYASISTSFAFALPLIALENGFTDEEVGFLIAVPSFIGFTLFWTGGASGVRLSLRGAIVSLVIAIAHILLAGMHTFGLVTVATTIYALAVANAGGLVNAIRICYARLMACRGMKAHFASISGTFGQSDNVLNIPIITTIIALSSISASLVVYAAVALLTAVWYCVIMRDRLDQVQRLFVSDTLPDKVNEAMAMFKECQQETDSGEGEAKEEGGDEPTISIVQIMAYLEKNKLQREGMVTMLELVDEKLDGRITEEQFVNCFRAAHELENDSVHGSGSSFAKAASLRKTGSEKSTASDR